MTGRVRAVRGRLSSPGEPTAFALVAGFGLLITVAYWIFTYEVAGTALLAGFTLASGLVTGMLWRARAQRRGSPAPAPITPGEADDDRPFQDETGPIPSPTLAPFAIGLGLAIGITAPIFGIAPLLVGLLPVAWGTWRWLGDAMDELRAADRRAPDRARVDDRQPTA